MPIYFQVECAIKAGSQEHSFWEKKIWLEIYYLMEPKHYPNNMTVLTPTKRHENRREKLERESKRVVINSQMGAVLKLQRGREDKVDRNWVRGGAPSMGSPEGMVAGGWGEVFRWVGAELVHRRGWLPRGWELSN